MKLLLVITLLLIPFVIFSQVTDSATHISNRDSLSQMTEKQKAQKIHDDTRPVLKRISLGGSSGFWVNVKQTHIEVAPLLAYHFPKLLTTGMGYRYIYTRDRFYGKNLNTYGPNLFARAQLTKRIYFWSEYEFLQTEYAYELVSQEVTTRKEDIESFFAGLGYIHHLGRKKRGGISFQLLYNFLYDRENYSPYYSPVIYRIGYFF